MRRLLLADHGPFDTDARRVYLYALGGITAMFDNDFGGGVELKSPGDFNATLGAGAGVNLDRHWGIEAQFFNVAPNVNASPYGKFSEIDNITVLLLGRFRWPFLGGRLVPYATAGIGAGTFDLNDSRSVVDIPTTQGTAVTARTPSLAVQATCVAEYVVDDLGFDALVDDGFFAADGHFLNPDLADQPEIKDALTRAAQSCVG